MSDVTDEELGTGADATGPADWGEPRTRTVSWYDPQIALRAKAQMTGLQYVQAVADGRLPPQPINSLINFSFSAVTEGQVTVSLIPDESQLNTNGLVHGGVLCTVMDAAMGIAALTTQPAGRVTVTAELKVSFLKPVPHDGGGFSVVGHVLRAGRNLTFAEAHAYGPAGVLIGHGSATLAAVAS